MGKGGDIFTLTGEFTRSGDFMVQVGFIVGIAHVPFVSTKKPLYLLEPSEPVSEGVETVPLLRSPLTSHLAEWDIPYAAASRHYCRLDYGVHGKRYFTVGFPNVADGHGIRSRYFKGCIPPKDVSLIKPEGIASDMRSVFGGFMDFLSADTLGIGGNGNGLVLDSVVDIGKAMKHLDGYGHIDRFLDHDESGRRTLEVLKGHYGGRVCDRSALYNDYKNLNECLQWTAEEEMNSNLKIKRQRTY